MIRKNPASIKAKFGAMVRKRRAEMGLSQEQVAERADLHRTYIADIERGSRNVSLENIEKIAIALEIPVSTIFKDMEKT